MITLLRVLFGFIVASLVAGAVTVAFVVTPAELAALAPEVQPERIGNAGVLALLTATHSAIFAFPFALVAIGFAELWGLRSIAYYLGVSLGIALGGLFAAYAHEVQGQPSIYNNYALIAYVTVGLAGGLTYWLLAGRAAGGRRFHTPQPPQPSAPAAAAEAA